MNDNYQSRKNCLQWGLRILPLKIYYAILKKYSVYLLPDAYEIIRKAQEIPKGKIWWWQWLGCEIVEDRIWVNIATGRRIAFWYSGNIGKFQTWAAYESFREELRKATGKRLRANPHLS